MNKSESAGVVVLREEGCDDYPSMLLVEQYGKSWSVPKGHVKDGENSYRCAFRELYEETGLINDNVYQAKHKLQDLYDPDDDPKKRYWMDIAERCVSDYKYSSFTHYERMSLGGKKEMKKIHLYSAFACVGYGSVVVKPRDPAITNYGWFPVNSDLLCMEDRVGVHELIREMADAYIPRILCRQVLKPEYFKSHSGLLM